MLFNLILNVLLLLPLALLTLYLIVFSSTFDGLVLSLIFGSPGIILGALVGFYFFIIHLLRQGIDSFQVKTVLIPYGCAIIGFIAALVLFYGSSAVIKMVGSYPSRSYLKKNIGQVVEISGIAKNFNIGPGIHYKGTNVILLNFEPWSDKNHQEVRVQGRVSVKEFPEVPRMSAEIDLTTAGPGDRVEVFVLENAEFH